jgi:hypothetical protein
MQELDRDREIARTRPAGAGLEWKKMDLHIHTPASSDYRDPGISYLDILKKAEEKSLDMIAFTDHNSVGGYAAMHRELETLTLLERLGRMTDVERETLNEYRRLLAKITVLPGFEFTATFGFHILGIFPEGTSVRKLEYLLLNLNVPEEKMVIGAPDVGSTSDVLTAYQAITSGGGLAIAAHANSSNGVAMQGFPFGGQTKIAYTQDHNLVALEVTDLEVTGRRTTASFYNGSKPEYPRRMHLIQGSDAHALDTEQIEGNKRLGVGARITEVLVKDASFASLKELLTGTDFTRTRPYRASAGWSEVEQARKQGPNMTQSFHERAVSRTNRTRGILHDIVAFSNAQGGTIYVGVSQEAGVPVSGIERPEEAVRILKEDVRRTIEPPVDPEFMVKGNADRGVLVIQVPQGSDAPYAFTPTGQIYIRLDGESVVASRDEIVQLVLEASQRGMARVESRPPKAQRPAATVLPTEVGEPMAPSQQAGRAVPVPAQPQAPARQGQQATSTPQPAQDTHARGDRREGRRDDHRRGATPPAQPEAKAEPQQVAPAQPKTQPPGQQATPGRPSIPLERLANLPPEKLKGQVRPMVPPALLQSEQAAPSGQLEMPQPVSASAVEEAAPEAIPATPGEGLELVPSPAEKPAATRGRGRRTRDRKEAAETTPEPVAVEAAAPAEVEAEKPAKGRRGRTRKTADTPIEEVETPTEATVSAEHLSREEIVAAELREGAEKPTKGRSGRSRKRDAELLVEAPTAAAAETEAGLQATLVDAEMEPGPQIPAELPEQAEEPELSSPPARKGRSRRKAETEAQKEAAAEARAGAQAQNPEQATAKAGAAAPEKKPRSRSRKKAGETEQTEAQGPVEGVEPPDPPTNGVEIVSTEERNGTMYHTVRDLRNLTTVHNVTRKSARRLWHYAIVQHEHGDPSPAEIAWHPNAPIGVWRREHRAGATRYDLVARYPDGSMRVFYGVSDEGLQGPWGELVRYADEAGYTGPNAVEQ